MLPESLPPYDVCRLELKGTRSAAAGADRARSLWLMRPMWWAGKEFREANCSHSVWKRNEKTKVVAKLTKRGGGAPAMDPVVSESERKAMMAHYFKKQEEMKKLFRDDDN